MLIGMWFLLACTETMVVDNVEDELRAALDITREGDPFGFYWFTNSPVSCEPEEVSDDPTTAPDEEADAYTWWTAEVATAFSREDGMNVFVVTGAPGDGSFTAGWNLSALGAAQAVVAWIRVSEASLTEMTDYWLVYDVEDYASGLGVGDVEVDAGGVRVETEAPGPQLTAVPEPCTYVGMRNLLEQIVGAWMTAL